MITTITLTTRTHGGWIARLPDQCECFVPDVQVNRYPGTGAEFTAVIVQNDRGYPDWFAKRIRPFSEVTPDDVSDAMDRLPILGYSHAAEMGYSDGQCDKIIAMRDGKPVDGGNRTWYVENSDDYYVGELE